MYTDTFIRVSLAGVKSERQQRVDLGLSRHTTPCSAMRMKLPCVTQSGAANRNQPSTVIASLTNLYKELTDDPMDGCISITNHRLNQIMKLLTVVTVIFLPLSLLVSMYGMNYEYIPELKFKYGYFILLGLMATIAISLLLLFRKMRWL